MDLFRCGGMLHVEEQHAIALFIGFPMVSINPAVSIICKTCYVKRKPTSNHLVVVG